jgi:hypothetical protein
MITVDWSQFKVFVDDRSLSVQFVELSDSYLLAAFDGTFRLDSIIAKSDPRNEPQIEFEDGGYKANGNKKLGEPKDSDGSPLQRVKITTAGWHYQLHGIEFSTSLLTPYSKKEDGSDYGYTTVKCYDADGNQLTDQAACDANAVKTVIDWEPTHDLEIIGGMVKQVDAPAEDVRVWVIGVPDVPVEYGGSKPFAVNVNMKFMGKEEGVKVDGRAPKFLSYNAVIHTSKLRLIFKHPAGLKHQMHMIFELFKA